MNKNAHRRPRDLNQLAKPIVDEATGELPTHNQIKIVEKNPAAVELGRLGGLKGGRARAESLTAQQRSDIARKAATERWRRVGLLPPC